MKFFKCLLFCLLLCPEISYSQSGIATVTADWSGGWCQICCGVTGNYACNGVFGISDWNNGQKSFTDPVPAGNIITDVRIILYWVGCGADPDTFNFSINNQLISSLIKVSGSCQCGDCEIDTVSNSWACSSGGLPNYIYGGTNIFSLGFLGGSVCVDKAVINLYHVYPDTAFNVSTFSSDVTCGSGNNGVASLSVCGGTSPYTYQWSTGDTTEDISGLVAGSYTVTITDDSGTVVIDSVLIQQVSLILTMTSSDATCQGGNDGSASVFVQGGVPCYSYVWSSGGTSSTETGLTAGTYFVTVTDYNGCTSTDSVSLSFIDSIPSMPDSIIGPISPCEGSSQTYFVNDSLFSGSWSWTVPSGWTINSGQGTSSIGVTVGSSLGNICVRKCNNSCCSSFLCMAVAPVALPPPPPSISGPTSPCAGATVSYSFVDSWFYSDMWTVPSGWTILSGQGTNFITVSVGIASGNVCVRMCGTCGCSAYQCMAVSPQSAPAAPGTISGPTNLCEGSTENYSVTVVGASSYQWTVPSGWTITGQGTTSITVTPDTGSGDICVRACNGCGCSAFNCITVTIDPPVIADFTYNGNQCLTGNNFCFTNIGTTGANYIWDFGDGMGTSTSESPCYTYTTSGCYDVTHTVTLGACSDVIVMTVCVFSEPTVSITGTDVTCNGYCDGAASVGVSGGTPPYAYSWIGGINLCADTYYVTITDINGCTATDSIIISEPDIIDLTFNSQNACGSALGEASVVATGGTSPFTYLWNDPSAQTTDTASDLTAGTYTVLVTDANACYASDSATVYDSGSVSVSILSYTNVSCNGGCDGSATANSTCGSFPYTYLWNDSLNQTNQVITGLCAGSYEVIVTDSSGQTDTANVTITEPSPLSLTLTSNDMSCYDLCDGSVTANASGGTPPYTYGWYDPTFFIFYISGATFSGLCEGIYCQYVEDTNGCAEADCITLNGPPAIYDSILATICSNESIFLEGAYQNTAGIYYDSLLSVDICDSVITTSLSVNPLPTVSFSGLDSSYCSTDAAVAMTGTPIDGTFSGTGVANNYFYPTIGIGTYTVVYSYTDSNNCTNNTSQIVSVDNCTGLKQSTIPIHQSIIVYPNPNAGHFTLEMELPENTNLKIQLYHFTGQLIFSEEISNVRGKYALQIDVQDFAKGIYYLQIVTEQGMVIRKIIHQ